MVLDDLVRAVADLVESIRRSADANDAQTIEQQAAELEQFLQDGSVTVRDPETGAEETVSLSEVSEETPQALLDLLGELPEESQELILEPLQPERLEQGENIRQRLQESEGAAVGQAATVLGATLGLETATGGQLESQQFIVSQLITFLALEDVLGKELEVTIGEGVQPLLEQQINAEFRSKQVNLQDVVEQSLREKDSDTDYLQDIASYGIKPEDESILEQVALNAMEFEELVETPAELGLVVDDDVLDAELDRAGYAEPTKDFLRQVNGAIRRSARVYQELLVSEDLVSTLDTLVEDGVISPEEATDRIPDEVDADRDAFRQRFRLLERQPAGAPSATEFEDAAFNGLSSVSALEEQISQTDFPVNQYQDQFDAKILGEIDGDLQRAVGLGLVDETTYANLAERVGLDDETVDLLLQGQSLDDISQRRLAEQTAPGEQSVRTIVGIGESRGAALEAEGVETVRELAGVDAEPLSEVLQVSPETAGEFIERAVQRVQGR